MAVDNPLRKRDTGQLLGPLTTSWSMPPSCTVFLQPATTISEIYRGQQCALDGTVGVPQDHTDCWPPATEGAPKPTPPFFGWGIYSPGIACPTGYVTACTAEYGKRLRSGGWATAQMQYDIEPGETAVGCCPSGYTCDSWLKMAGTCVAIISTAARTQTVIPTGVCSGTDLASTVMATFPDVITVTSVGTLTGTEVGTTIETTTRQATLYAPMFQLYYQQKDLPGGGSGEISGSSGRSASASASGSGAPRIEQIEGSGGLSPAATAGIAVGAIIAGLLLVGLGFCLFMRRRKRRRADEPSSAWAAGNELPGHDRPTEMPSPYYSSVSSPAAYQNDKWVVTELAANGEGNHPVELAVASPTVLGGHENGGNGNGVESAR